MMIFVFLWIINTGFSSLFQSAQLLNSFHYWIYNSVSLCL